MTSLKELTRIVEYLGQLEQEIIECENHLASAKRTHQAFSREHIPDLMADAGVSELSLENGAKVSIIRKYFANISQERSEDAFKWLKESKNDSIIKTEIYRTFDKTQEDQVDLIMLKQFFDKHEIEFNESKAVHPQTLKAFVKDQMEQGNKDFPAQTFGVFVVDETAVKKSNKP